MSLLIGTDDGLFRVEEIPFDAADVERVLDGTRVTGVRRFDHAADVYAATTTGAFRSADGGRTWTDLGVPCGDSDVCSILATSDGAIYAGTNDPYLYRSDDEGDTWSERTGFRELPSRSVWRSPVNPDRARLRALEAPADEPDRLIAGIESGGIHTSADGGETWVDRRDAIQDDIHHVSALSSTVYLAATGFLDLELESLDRGHALGAGGVYRTTDGAESWTRLDVGNDHSYVREVFVHDGVTYFCGSTTPPPEWRGPGADAALFESTDGGRTFERVSYPGEPRELIEAWTAVDDGVVAGTSRHAVPRPDGTRGRILLRDDHGEYHTVGVLSENVTSIETV